MKKETQIIIITKKKKRKSENTLKIEAQKK